MTKHVIVALLFAAVSASAATPVPSFEFSVGQLQSIVATLRADQAKVRAESNGPQIDFLTQSLQRDELETNRLRSDLRWLQERLRRHGVASSGRPGPGRPGPGRPGPDRDGNLRWDVMRFTRDLDQLTQDARARVTDLHFLTSSAGKDATLVVPATRLLESARRLKTETNWLLTDARFAHFDFLRAGYSSEGWDLDRNSRDLDASADNLTSDADRLLVIVRP